MLRRLSAASLIAAAAMALSAPWVGAQTSETISGFEIAATSTVGTFVGVIGLGPLAGLFQAQVDHAPLSATGITPITGGTLEIRLARGGTLDGSFAPASGTIAPINPEPGCSNQTYQVTDAIQLAPDPSRSVGFSVILTHHRFLFFGRCLTYFATVSGTLSGPAPAPSGT